MVEVKIDVTELKPEGEEIIKKLVGFLEEKTESKVKAAANELIIDVGEEVSKQYLRVLLRKFLHKNGLKDYFRVISGKEGSLKVKERKISAEE
ncbi:MAG: 60S ribosomal protein L22 [Nitrososphaerota archaeon]|nr:60S ribosomal protein L22 [Candidatus Bathyarchaeota archaeon]MDW8023171.1 60S ribosomal protein L22 [Nitrososphaerota archaeon]